MIARAESPTRSYGPLARGCGCCLTILAGAAALVLVASLALVSSCREWFASTDEEAPTTISTELPRFGDFQPRKGSGGADRSSRGETDSRLAEARACILRGELTRARRLLLPLAPGSSEAAVALAIVEDRLGRLDAALCELREAGASSRQARELLEFTE